MLKDAYPYYLANEAIFANRDLVVTDKYTGEAVSVVAKADPKALDQAIQAAADAAPAMAQLAPYERQHILEHCIQRFEARADELAMLLCVEAGKPITDARGEVTRLIDTFRVASAEAINIDVGDTLELATTARAHGYRGFTRRVPVGPCSFIAPFNFPLNLAAHKIAPAIAAGCPFVLKPASNTPLSAMVIGEILAETSLPKGAFSILPCDRDAADLLTTDERIKLLSFTGSPEVGWQLKSQAGKKKVVLELGGDAACIVDSDADLVEAVNRVSFGSFYQSGQSCISVQRIYVHTTIYQRFKERLLDKIQTLEVGDPRDADTNIGPLITEKEAKRVQAWVQEAVNQGATLLCGGERNGAIVTPTLLEHVPASATLMLEEVFGPVAMLIPFEDFDQVLEAVNSSRYGLQTGIFTRDLYKVQQAWDRLNVGGVIIGDVPSWRVDSMPYGGVKDSGFGREGVRWAIKDMTEERLLVVRTIPDR